MSCNLDLTSTEKSFVCKKVNGKQIMRNVPGLWGLKTGKGATWNWSFMSWHAHNIKSNMKSCYEGYLGRCHSLALFSHDFTSEHKDRAADASSFFTLKWTFSGVCGVFFFYYFFFNFPSMKKKMSL